MIRRVSTAIPTSRLFTTSSAFHPLSISTSSAQRQQHHQQDQYQQQQEQPCSSTYNTSAGFNSSTTVDNDVYMYRGRVEKRKYGSVSVPYPVIASLPSSSYASSLPCASSSSLQSQQRRFIHTHRSIFQLCQELNSWHTDWPLKPVSNGTGGGGPTPLSGVVVGGGADANSGFCGTSRREATAMASSSSSISAHPSQLRHLGTSGAGRPKEVHQTTSPDHWSPLQIAEFITEAITQQSATDQRGRTVHPSSFVKELPWSFFSASRLATVPRLKHFTGDLSGYAHKQQQGAYPPYPYDADTRGYSCGAIRGGRGGGAPYQPPRRAPSEGAAYLHPQTDVLRDEFGFAINTLPSAATSTTSLSGGDDKGSSSSSSALSHIHGPMVLMFHGSPVGMEILKHGARFMHDAHDAQGIYMTPSLACARGYASIRRVEMPTTRPSGGGGGAAKKGSGGGDGGGSLSSRSTIPSLSSPSSSVSSVDDDCRLPISAISAAGLRQRGILVCLVSLGKVYHRYGDMDPEAEALIANGQWALEGSRASDAEANAAEGRAAESSDAAAAASYSPQQYHSQSPPILARGGHRRAFVNPNDDPLRPYDSYVDFVDGEQIYCIRNPDNIIPIVALGINKQAGV